MKNEDIIKMFDDLCRIVLKAIEVEQKTYSFRIPKIGASNGDIIKAMFPNSEVIEVRYFDEIDSHYKVNFGEINGNQSIVNFKADWWDAPYEGEIKE